jgi:hypothetical protein
LQRKQVQKVDREVVQQRRRQAQVLEIILQCSLLYMQLIVTGVSLCPSLGASYYGELLFQMHIQWANSSWVRSSLGRLWQNLSRGTIT